MAIGDVPAPDDAAGEMTAADSTTETTETTEGQENVSAPNVAPGLKATDKLLAWSVNPNIATDLSAETLSKMGERVAQEFQIDDTSRSGWLAQSRGAMDLAMQITKAKDYPWPKSSNVIYPLMTIAAIQFASRATPAIIPGRDVVKGVVYGPDDGQPARSPQDGTPLIDTATMQPVWAVPPGFKTARAKRIGEHMSYQLLEEQKEWRADTDKMLHILPIVGCHFRKTFFDSAEAYNCSMGVSAEKLVVNYQAKSLDRAPRATEIVDFYPNEIRENELSDVFLTPQAPYGPAQSSSADEDAPHEFLEQHRRWDLDGDGYAEPYIVTIHRATRQVVRVTARYDAENIMLRAGKIERINPIQYYTKFDFIPNPDEGFYGIGFGQLLRPINEAVNSTLNMLIDAGHLAVVGGGFIGRGLSLHSGSVKMQLGEWKVVNSAGGNIRDSIVPLPAKEPSGVLFSLLGTLIDAGKEIASVKDVLSGEINGVTMQPTTLLALIEQGLQVFTGIYGRVHDSLAQEFDKIARLNRVYLEDTASYKRGEEWKTVTRADYLAGTAVAPVSDPKMVSDARNMAEAAFLQSYQDDPMMDGVELRKEVFKKAKIENPDRFFAKQTGPSAADMMMQKQLENETIKTRASAIKDLALAQKAMAEADKTRGDAMLAVVDQQFSILQAELERLDDRAAAESEQAAAAAAV
jgi:chaperonin GroES